MTRRLNYELRLNENLTRAISEEIFRLIRVSVVPTTPTPSSVLAHLVCPILLGERALAMADAISIFTFVLISVRARAYTFVNLKGSDLLCVGPSTMLFVVCKSSFVDLTTQVDLPPVTLHPVPDPVALAYEIGSHVHS